MKLKQILITSLIIGLGTLAYSFTIDLYADSDYAKILLDSYDAVLTGETPIVDLPLAEIEIKLAKMITNKLKIMNIGTGISIFTLLLLLYFYKNKIHTVKDFHQIHTIIKPDLKVLSIVTWFFVPIGIIVYYNFRILRGDFGPDNDNYDGYSRVMFWLISRALILWIPLIAFTWISTIKSRLPAKIFVKADKYISLIIVLEILFGFLLILNLIVLLYSIYDGNHIFIPISMIYIYVLLCLRAGQISRWNDYIHASL